MVLEGRVIVVTGASRGLGAAIAIAAADAGAAIVGGDIEPTAPDERIVMRTVDVTGSFDSAGAGLSKIEVVGQAADPAALQALKTGKQAAWTGFQPGYWKLSW